jgi:hypothetical protein
VASLRATSPDGREWRVSVHRVRFPGWHHSSFEPYEEDLKVYVLELVFVAPLMWFVFPLLRAIALLPLSLARGLSSTRWVEAVCRDPGEIKITWRTRREVAERVANEVATRLSRGYEELTPPEAEFVEMTEPPGLRDQDV